MKDFNTLVQDMKADKTLAEKIRNEYKAIENSGEGLFNVQVLAKVLKSLGYDVTESDIEKAQAEGQELDVQDLEAVSGGGENEVGLDGDCIFLWGCDNIFFPQPYE